MSQILYINWDLDPVLINAFGKIPLGYYGICFVFGIFLSFRLFRRMCLWEGISTEHAERLLLYVFIGVLIGARLAHCLFYDFEYFSVHLMEIFLPIDLSDGGIMWIGYRGLASHGGAVGLVTVLLIYAWKYKQNFLQLIDRIAVVSPLAAAFIRIGNLFNSEIIGRPAPSLPFAFVFHRVDSIPRHPVQLYEAICYLLIFGTLWWMYTKYRSSFKPGFFLGLCIFLIFSFRLGIEFLKENQSLFENGMPLNMGQLLSIPFILIGIGFIWYARKVSL